MKRLAGVRDDDSPPHTPSRKKQPCKKEGKKKPERTEGSRDTVTHFDSTSNKTVRLTHTGEHNTFFFPPICHQ